MTIWWFLPLIVGMAFALTWGVRRYAISGGVMDVPNARSSHSMPTPRGGGVAIVLSFFCSVPLLIVADIIPLEIAVALTGAGGVVALLGFLDDHGHVAARWRLLGHFLSALWVLVWLEGMPVLKVLDQTIDLGWAGHVLAALYLVWLLNLYNFMDGIDGIAGVEAISVCIGGALLYCLVGATSHATLPLFLAAAVAGFLLWNFPPAKIFMGDAGSGFLGVTLGVLSLQAAWIGPELLWSWLILLGVFVVDATWTLIRRLLRGEKFYEAHRSHAYQRASRLYGQHLSVTLGVVGINVLWLLPLALVVGAGYLNGILGVVIAYVPLLLLALKFGAGESDAQPVSV